MQVMLLDVLPVDATSREIDVFVVSHNGQLEYLTAAQLIDCLRDDQRGEPPGVALNADLVAMT
jgi:hypothetical protein